jgi:hypothetical protein
MSSATVELDKQFTSEAGDSYGTLSIRVVVLKPKTKADDENDDAPAEPDVDLDEPELASSGKSPLAAYLEKQAHGRWCVVFLISGQRHHAWDNAFISKDLGFKYLRDRTMIMVDLDGLAMNAMAEIIQGSRQGLFEGKVFFAIKDRIIQTLKTDPDLKRLQVEAEQKVLEMEAGDEAVKNKLDQLIEGHHVAAHTDGPGNGDPGPHSADAPHFASGAKGQSVVVMGPHTLGEQAESPVLVTSPRIVAVRMLVREQKNVTIISSPREEWATLEDFRVNVVCEAGGLMAKVTRAADHAVVTVTFEEADDFDEEDYPVQGELQAFARFKDRPETRMLKVPVVVAKKKKEPEKVELLDDPTFLKVKSRQPIRIIPGGPAVHVKLQWNGQESLIRGTRPAWKFGARCLTLGTFPKIGFGSTGNGRLELVLYPPHGLLTNNELQFEVVATGPAGREMKATFRAVVVPQPTPGQVGPRKIVAEAPETAGQRRPPYELKYVYEKDYADPNCRCWDLGDWTQQDAGSFKEPTTTTPLIIFINQDMELLKTWRDSMVKKNVAESRIKERVNHYISLVAYHLWQMYGEFKRKSDLNDENVRPPSPEEQRAEINRVGTTIMKVMEVSR